MHKNFFQEFSNENHYLIYTDVYILSTKFYRIDNNINEFISNLFSITRNMQVLLPQMLSTQNYNPGKKSSDLITR